MVWFFVSLVVLFFLLKAFARFRSGEGDFLPEEHMFSKRCIYCARETRYQIAGQYAFIDCEYCGQKNFALNPGIDPALLDSLAGLDAVLPKDHRLFDFFAHAYLVSCLAIAKSDGFISGVERDFILTKLRSFLGSGYNESLAKRIYEQTVTHFTRFSDLNSIELTLVYEVWHALLFIRQQLPKQEGYELIEFLLSSVFETAYADEVLDPREAHLLREFAARLGLTSREYEARLAAARAYSSAKNAYDRFSQRKGHNNIPASVYELFGVTPQSTKAEIKKAYLRLAKHYHPDRYHHLPEQMQKSAEEKFKEVAGQYELLLQRAPR